MHQFGRFSVYLGLVLGVTGLVGGFGLMFAGIDLWAKPLIGLVPIGFLLVFTGLVTTLVHSPRKTDEPPRPPL